MSHTSGPTKANGRERIENILQRGRSVTTDPVPARKQARNFEPQDAHVLPKRFKCADVGKQIADVVSRKV